MEKAISRSISAIGKVVLAVMLAVGMVNAASFEVKAEDDVIELTQDNIEKYIVYENEEDDGIYYELKGDCSYYLGGNINLEKIDLNYKEAKYKYFCIDHVNLDLKGHELSGGGNIVVLFEDLTIENNSNNEGKISAPGCGIAGEIDLNNVTIECSQNPKDYSVDKFWTLDADVKIDKSSIISYYFEIDDDTNITMLSGCISCTEFINRGEVTVTGGSVNGEITNDGKFQYAVWLDSDVETSLNGSLVDGNDGKYTLVNLGENYSVILYTAGNNCLTLNVDGYDNYDYNYDNDGNIVLTCDKIESVVKIEVIANDGGHDLQYTPANEATCIEDGNSEYWYCNQCGRYFSDENATKEMSKEDTVVPATGHKWVESDSESYETDKEKITIKFTCEYCKETREENLVIETVSRDINAHSTLKWSDLLTADEIMALFEDGAEEIDFDLSVSKYDEAPEEDAELIEDKINELYSDIEYTISYLDIDVGMYIKYDVDKIEYRPFEQTLNPVTITVEMPEELQDAEGNEYTVIRVHDGEAEEIDCSEEEGMISFTSDKFSTYAIVKISEVGQASEGQYTDESDEDALPSDGDSQGGITTQTDEELDVDIDEDALSVNEAEESDSVKTNDNTNMFIYAAGLALSLAGIVLYERKRRYNN